MTVRPSSSAGSDAASPKTISGAPSTQVPPSANETALHLRADENGTYACTSGAAASGNGSRRQRAVEFASGAAPYQASVPSQPGAAPVSGCEPSNSMSPPVSVPVLSRQITSTRARPSTAGSSFTSTCRPASFAAPTAKAIDVTSTRPSGIMAVSDAIVFTTACTQVPLSHACTQPPATIICALSTSRPIGPTPQPTHVSTRSIEVRSSEETIENRFASSANLFA